MKPFNLEEAKAGKPVCTGEGFKVKLLGFNKPGDFPIYGIVMESLCKHYVNEWRIDGKCGDMTDDFYDFYHLFMVD